MPCGIEVASNNVGSRRRDEGEEGFAEDMLDDFIWRAWDCFELSICFDRVK